MKIGPIELFSLISVSHFINSGLGPWVIRRSVINSLFLKMETCQEVVMNEDIEALPATDGEFRLVEFGFSFKVR